MKINEYVRNERIKNKLSQKELGKLSGISTSKILRFENGQQDMTYGYLINVLHAMGKDLKVVNKK